MYVYVFVSLPLIKCYVHFTDVGLGVLCVSEINTFKYSTGMYVYFEIK